MADGQRPQQNGIHQAEDRGICANPERQRRDGDGSEAWTLAQHPQCVAEILHKILNEVYSAHVAALLLPLLKTVHRAEGYIASLLWRRSLGDLMLDSPLDVITNLLVQFLFHLLTAED